MKYLLMFLMLSCGKNFIHYEAGVFIEDTKSYQFHEMFKADYKVRVGKEFETMYHIKVKFSKYVYLNNQEKIGMCIEYHGTNKREIVLSETKINKVGDFFGYVFYIHEMGHCAFDLEHSDSGEVYLMRSHIDYNDYSERGHQVNIDEFFRRVQ